MARKISQDRNAAYYVGLLLQILGGLLFGSVIVTFITRSGDFTDFEGRARSEALRAFIGIALMMINGIIRGFGSKGLAGSDVLLDPERARQELEPYSRMAGGMVRDTMDEARLDLGREPERVIVIKCRECAALNSESANFCQECGIKL
jgi:hypothetical protein